MSAAAKPEITTHLKATEHGTSVVIGERPPTTALIRPVASPLALMELHKEIAAVVGSILTPGTDYGVIPGTGNKPALLKPGAERVCFAFGCAPGYEVIAREIDHDRKVEWTKRKKVWNNKHRGDKSFTWQEESGTSLGLYRYEVRCRLVRREDGATVAEGLASCSTMESKYIDRPRDTENTVLKMAQKRALVAAVLNGFGLSDRFTQDVEDTAGQTETPAAEPVPTDDGAADAAKEEAQRKWEEASKAALAEIEEMLPTLPGKQQDYVRENLRDGANPVALLEHLKTKAAKV